MNRCSRSMLERSIGNNTADNCCSFRVLLIRLLQLRFFDSLLRSCDACVRLRSSFETGRYSFLPASAAVFEFVSSVKQIAFLLFAVHNPNKQSICVTVDCLRPKPTKLLRKQLHGQLTFRSTSNNALPTHRFHRYAVTLIDSRINLRFSVEPYRTRMTPHHDAACHGIALNDLPLHHLVPSEFVCSVFARAALASSVISPILSK